MFDIQKIRAINLSKNNLNKLGLQIGRKLKADVSHINWIDLTMNDFDADAITVNTLVQGIKSQKDMIHVGLTVRGQAGDQLVRIV